MITRDEFLSDQHGRGFVDVLDDPGTPFSEVLDFFNDAERQQRLEDSEVHHDRAPLAGVVRELEADPVVHRFFATLHRRRSGRMRQAVRALVRMIMERRGWQTTGKKVSLGVPGSDSRAPYHNARGLAFWFIRAERFHREDGMPYRTVRERCEELESADPVESTLRVPATEDGAASSPRGKASS